MEVSKKVLLGDVASIQTGPFGSQLHQKDYVDIGTPILTVEHLGQDRISTQNLPMVSEQDKQRLKKYWLSEGDTVFSRVGSVDRASYVHKEEDGWLFSGRCLRVSPDKEKVNPRFLSFLLRSPNFTDYIKSIAVGATMPSINTKLLATAPIMLPPRSQQDFAAEVLDQIERKIELNRRMNEALEQMGQVLFKHYFITNPNAAKWKQELLGDYLKVERGLSYKGAFLSENTKDMPMINLGSFALDGTYNEDNIKYYSGEFKDRAVVTPGDIVLANTDMTQDRVVLGAVLRVPKLADKVLFTHHVYGLRNLKLPEEFIYYLLKRRSFRERAQGFATGTTVLFMPAEAITKLQFKLPPEEIRDEFVKNVCSIFERKEIIRKEIQNLIALRDVLLPRLISGRIKV